jgi:hypothetical protein
MKTSPIAIPASATATTRLTPAKQAREALATQPALPDQPFGKLVSEFARARNDDSSKTGT